MNGAVVLQVLPMLETGGVERGTVEMVQAIHAAGGVPIVASAGGRLVSAVTHAGGRHVAMRLQSKDPLEILLNALRLVRLIRREKVSLVHARSRAPAWSAFWAARWTGVKFVTTYHGVYSEDFPGKRLYNRVMARGDRVIVGSRYMADHVLARHPVQPPRLRVIPRGVDPTIFNPDTISGVRIAKLAEQWNLPMGRTVIMLPGRLSRWKGQSLLIQALARIADQNALAVLVGADQGRDSYASSLLAEARRLGVADRVIMAGHCDDMPAALMLADLVVAPSIEPEAFGRAVIEAQVMAKPVIASDHGATTETIEQAVTGWRIPPGNVEALVEAIDGIMGWPEESRMQLGRQAREAVIAQFSVAAMQTATLDVYHEILSDSP